MRSIGSAYDIFYRAHKFGENHLIVYLSQDFRSFGFKFDIEKGNNPSEIDLTVKVLFWTFYIEFVRWSEE